MASSGSLNTSAYNTSDGTRLLTFSWKITSQSIDKNTTTISWSLDGGGTTGQYVYTGAIKVTIDGKEVYSFNGTRFPLYNGTHVADGTYTFTHDETGKKSFTAYVESAIYLYTVNCKGTKTFELDLIARASQPSCITWPEHTQNVGEFGDEISIHMNRKNSSFTHTVRYKFGTKSGTIATGVTTGTTWVIPLTLMDLIPSATKGSGTIYVDTYNGSTMVGTQSCGFTATVPASVKPSLTVTLDDTTGIDNIYGSPVKGLSKIKITPKVTVAYSSPIASYAITANGVTYNTETATTGFLTTSGNSKVTVTVKDKRGRSATWTYTMNVLDYEAPVVSMLTVRRCDSNGVETDQGECVELLLSGEVSPINNKNTAVYSVRYKKSSEDSWTDLTVDVNGWKPSDLTNNYAVNNYSLIFVADGNSSYDVEVSVTDNHNTTTRVTSVSTAFTLFNCHPDGTGWRFGGVAEESHTLQNDLVFIQTANQYCFSSIGAASTDGYILMARITVTETNSDTPITFVFSRRKAQAPMTVHVLFKATSDTDPGLASIRYEGDNYEAYLTSQTESVWDLYIKKVSNSDTITLNNWFTSYRQMKRVNVEFVGSIASQVPTGRFGYYRATPFVSRSILDCFMPVGYILTLYSHADPNDMYPGTTWVRMVGTFLWGVSANETIGQTGGAKTHTLTTAEMPSHSHGSVYSGNGSGTKNLPWLSTGVLGTGDKLAYSAIATGGGGAHNNMPPYTQVSIWRRTA